MAGLALTGSKERLAAFGAAGRVVVHSMRLLIRRHGSLPRSLYVATGGVVAALLLSLFLSRVAHFPLPVSAQVPFYIAIFLAARTGGLLAGIAAFALALGASDFFLTEPIYEHSSSTISRTSLLSVWLPAAVLRSDCWAGKWRVELRSKG